MKPTSEASGVRSSWLALATKSTRMRSIALLLGEVIEDERDEIAHAGDRRRAAANQAENQRSVGTPLGKLDPLGRAALGHAVEGGEEGRARGRRKVSGSPGRIGEGG